MTTTIESSRQVANPVQRPAHEDWSARQYLKFEDERTRPPRDLIAQMPLQRPRLVVDLGCGPGNSTDSCSRAIRRREVIGLNSSPDMLRKARERLPNASSSQADLASWTPAGHRSLFRQCRDAVAAGSSCDHAAAVEAMPDGGVLAVQMPDNTREPALAFSARWRERAVARRSGDQGGAARRPAAARSLLRSAQAGLPRIDIWHTVYNHVMAAPVGHRRMVQGLLAAPVPVAARRRRAGAISRRLYGKNRQRLQAALRRQGAAALPAAVHRGGAVSMDVSLPDGKGMRSANRCESGFVIACQRVRPAARAAP